MSGPQSQDPAAAADGNYCASLRSSQQPVFKKDACPDQNIWLSHPGVSREFLFCFLFFKILFIYFTNFTIVTIKIVGALQKPRAGPLMQVV